MCVRFLLVFDLLFIIIRIALWPSAGKELSLGHSICVVLILMPSLLYVSLSHLVFGAGCGIRLYRFLIIAFLSKIPTKQLQVARGLITEDYYRILP